jgi:hypothetical protein
MKRLALAVVLCLGAQPGAAVEAPAGEAGRQGREDLAATRAWRWPVFTIDFLSGELLTPVGRSWGQSLGLTPTLLYISRQGEA